MKKLAVVLLMAASLMACNKEDVNEDPASIIGRWQLVGFDEQIRYEFTTDKRYTIYTDSLGDFPTLQEFQAENPDLQGNDWSYSGDTVVVDLNFGNYSKLLPDFKCENKVIDWTAEDGSSHSTYYREGHDISICN